MSDEEIRAKNRATIETSMGAVSDGDVDRQLALCTEDFVLELPYADPPKTVAGKETVRAYLKSALGVFQLRLSITEVYDCTDPDRLVLEYTSVGSVTTTGKPYANSYIAVATFRDGLVCRQREYYNPLPAARALSED
ncbi:MAG TPA: nuclear transport factor 2 family protein [Acidimicrobiales bacterium]